MKKSIIDELKKCRDEGCVTEIYNTYDDDDNFSVGIILDVNDEYFTYSAISKTSEFNGIRLDKTDTVYRICKKSRYISKLCEIIRIYNYDTNPEQFRCLSEANPTVFLRKSADMGMPVSVVLNDSDRYSITGFVKCADNELYEIETVDVNSAIINGTEIISTDSISYICCASFEEKILFELKKSGFLM